MAKWIVGAGSLLVATCALWLYGGSAANAASGFLLFPLDGHGPYNTPVTAVMDHDSKKGSIKTYTGETGSESNGCLAYVNSANVVCTKANKNAPRAYMRPKKKGVIQRWTTVFAYNDLASRGGKEYMWYDNHHGYDFAVEKWTPVLATARGEVLSVNEKWGQVTIDHSAYGYQYHTIYTHMVVSYPRDNTVKQGEVIGWVSNVSPKDQPVGVHLHFVVYRKNGNSWKLVDPYGGSGEPVLWK